MKNRNPHHTKAIYTATIALALIPLQKIQGASFNCSKASNIVESLICKDSSLSKKDEQMARLYKKAMSELPRSMQKGFGMINVIGCLKEITVKIGSALNINIQNASITSSITLTKASDPPLVQLYKQPLNIKAF